MEQTEFGMSIMSLMRRSGITPKYRTVIIDVGESHRSCREVGAQLQTATPIMAPRWKIPETRR